MRRYRLVVLGVLVVYAVVLAGVPAGAAPKSGCPVGTGWGKYSVEAAAATIWPALLDSSPWADEAEFAETAVRPFDRDGDGDLCVKSLWGEDLNPNSHWYKLGLEVLGSPAQLFLVKDNTSGA